MQTKSRLGNEQHESVRRCFLSRCSVELFPVVNLFVKDDFSLCLSFVEGLPFGWSRHHRDQHFQWDLRRTSRLWFGAHGRVVFSGLCVDPNNDILLRHSNMTH